MLIPKAVIAEEPPVIEVRNVVKEYRLGALEGLRTLGRRALGQIVPERQRFRALDDVSFSVKRGEVVGIIGHNGAGKSTLLKLLCNITSPSTGSVRIRGRVAPLIEVGAGLIGEMTGRENIYLNASILGMTKHQVNAKIDEIIAFAELEQFIDTPVKRFSSGMQVRLGFSIATAVLPEVLIVDEVLAVGDVAFQRKCIDRMEQIKNDPDRTVLIVGHNIRQLERMCSRMIILHHGKLIEDGEASEISSKFYRLTTDVHGSHEALGQVSAQGSEEASVKRALFQGESEEQASAAQPFELDASDKISVTLEIHVALPILDAEVNIGFHNPEMIFITKTSTRMASKILNLKSGVNLITFELDALRLAPGPYGLGIGIYDRVRRSIWSSTAFRWVEIKILNQNFTNLPRGTLTYADSNWELIK